MRVAALIMILVIFQSQALWAGVEENKAFRNKVNQSIKAECTQKNDNERFTCWLNKSPEKCQGLVLERNFSEWSRCVESCGSANWFSRTFGECSI